MSRVTFQGLILKLQNFWAERGCMIEMPLDIEVGAGTMHPATFLRVLGPEPWNVAYVQPSRRPADGRYGDNPFRLGKHYQFQVVLKPSPIDVQELYLDSLRAIGLDLTRHDIRFEEDNWESPTLGAWGVGWQILLDGMEITQFTYFQQAGGIDLAPVSAELTYGLERLTMFLRARLRSSTSSGARDSATVRCASRTNTNSRSTTSSSRTSAFTGSCSTRTKERRGAVSRRSSRCPRTSAR